MKKPLLSRGQRVRLALSLVACAMFLFLINVLNLSTGVQTIIKSHGLFPGSSGTSLRHSVKRKAAAALSSAFDHVARRAVPRPSDAAQGLTVPVSLPVFGTVMGDDLEVEICDFDMGTYHQVPEKYPMSTDLSLAFCPRYKNRKRMLSALKQEPSWGTGLQPTGFIFHESRSGSTLISNMLASAPVNLVYSEPHLPALIIKQCEFCDEAKLVSLLRDAILAMGHSSHHQNYWIKFQSAMVPYMHLILQAFPEVPWVFIFRDPVEVMVSNLRRGPTGPCVRTRVNPPAGIQRIMGLDRSQAMRASDEDYCAAHLASVLNAALTHLNAAGSRGQAVAYDDLPEDIVNLVVPGHFGLALSPEERDRMLEIAQIYSKSRYGEVVFEDDSEKKHDKATAAVALSAQRYLAEPTNVLHALRDRGREGMRKLAKLKAQEGHVYGRVGSRFFALPHCPDKPEEPPTVPVVDMIRNWNPDDIAVPARHHNTICRLDYMKDYDKALAYRDAEVPFIVTNVPEFDAATEKWNSPGYLQAVLGDKKYHTEVSTNNHFMYYRVGRHAPKNFTPPTVSQRLTYADWLAKANAARNISSDETHYYFRVSDPDADFVKQDLAIFAPVESLFMKEPKEQRGIHCRFGMRGVIAEGHFDSSRNMVALVSGTRRWILSHPRECHHSYLLPVQHPSGRHSEVDWSHPDLRRYPLFKEMRGSEVILTPGEVLYVPAWWLHYIVNLDTNIQCNTRSGDSYVGLADLHSCGFKINI